MYKFKSKNIALQLGIALALTGIGGYVHADSFSVSSGDAIRAVTEQMSRLEAQVREVQAAVANQAGQQQAPGEGGGSVDLKLPKPPIDELAQVDEFGLSVFKPKPFEVVGQVNGYHLLRINGKLLALDEAEYKKRTALEVARLKEQDRSNEPKAKDVADKGAPPPPPPAAAAAPAAVKSTTATKRNTVNAVKPTTVRK